MPGNQHRGGPFSSVVVPCLALRICDVPGSCHNAASSGGSLDPVGDPPQLGCHFGDCRKRRLLFASIRFRMRPTHHRTGRPAYCPSKLVCASSCGTDGSAARSRGADCRAGVCLDAAVLSPRVGDKRRHYCRRFGVLNRVQESQPLPVRIGRVRPGRPQCDDRRRPLNPPGRPRPRDWANLADSCRPRLRLAPLFMVVSVSWRTLGQTESNIVVLERRFILFAARRTDVLLDVAPSRREERGLACRRRRSTKNRHGQWKVCG